MLALPERPTAVFAESDEMAFGALRAIRRAGLRVPEDVAVIGFDDHAMAELMDLSTVRHEPMAQARDVTSRLLDHLAHPGRADEPPRGVVFDTGLVVRGSTDASRSAQ
jgi:LacI family transcriptional regulator, repressor for deo operon, udp, cdd, tsx, nupC, and nupG